jgi:hypothetical protein
MFRQNQNHKSDNKMFYRENSASKKYFNLINSNDKSELSWIVVNCTFQVNNILICNKVNFISEAIFLGFNYSKKQTKYLQNFALATTRHIHIEYSKQFK